jgi:hypothetical protein
MTDEKNAAPNTSTPSAVGNGGVGKINGMEQKEPYVQQKKRTAHYISSYRGKDHQTL